MKYLKIESSVTDFILFGKKFQEKICRLEIDGRYQVKISKNSRNTLGIKSHIPYFINDNDYYWIHIPDSTSFYIFPEKILIEKEFLSLNEKCGKKTLALYPINIIYKNKTKIKDKWTEQFKYDYSDTLCVEKIINLLS